MRKSLALAACAFSGLLVLWCAAPTAAQDTGSQAPTQAGGQEMHHGHGSRLEWLSKQLNLTDDQKTKLKPILDDESSQMKSIHEDSSLSQDQKRDKMKELRESTDTKIEDVLTPDQQTKFKELNAERKEHQKKMTNPPSGAQQPGR
jgi:periplasmic protein CpxP/Spy